MQSKLHYYLVVLMLEGQFHQREQKKMKEEETFLWYCIVILKKQTNTQITNKCLCYTVCVLVIVG